MKYKKRKDSKKEERRNEKTISFSSNNSDLSVEKKTEIDAINAKAKGTSKEDQIAYAKTNIEMHRITTERYYAIEHNTLDNQLKFLQRDSNQSITPIEPSEQDGEFDEGKEQETIRLNNAIEEGEAEKAEITKDIEHIEFKHPFKPIWNKRKLKIKQIVIIILFGLTAFVGYNLNLDFFTLIAGIGAAGFILSITVGLLDGYIGHAIGEQLAAKNTKKGLLYLLCGLALITVVYLGQEAAMRQEEMYSEGLNQALFSENTPELIQDETTVNTGLLRAAFIAFLFILSAALSYDYYKIRDEIFPHLVRDSLKKALSKFSNRIVGFKAELASAFGKKQESSKALDEKINTIIQKKEQLEILKIEELKKIDNLETRVIHIINQVYSNQH